VDQLNGTPHLSHQVVVGSGRTHDKGPLGIYQVSRKLPSSSSSTIRSRRSMPAAPTRRRRWW
jgi:hypothetical protein